jgi:hypothetical protein
VQKLRYEEPAFVESAKNQFWHPSSWKWGSVLLLIAASAFLFLWKPSPRPEKVELLPFTDLPPAWDGSYPYAMFSPIAGSSPLKFETSISLIKPTVRHDLPVNDFLVDLHTGRFVLRQTDLFVPDVMPLSLTRTYIAWDYHSRAFGVGGNHPYDICPTGTRLPYTYMDLNLEDFYQVHMPRISKGTVYADAVFSEIPIKTDRSSSPSYVRNLGLTIAKPGNSPWYSTETESLLAPTQILRFRWNKKS